MTNEEKARILSNKGCLGAYINKDAEVLNPTEEDRKRLSIYGACMEAMQWKDEEHKKEGQQLISKICKWIKEHYGIFSSTIPFWMSDFLDTLKQDMEKEI